jgi:hypothetical protein
MINGSFIKFSDITHVTNVEMASHYSKKQLTMVMIILGHCAIVLALCGLWLHKFAVCSESNSVTLMLLEFIIQDHDAHVSVHAVREGRLNSVKPKVEMVFDCKLQPQRVFR